jgi:hypothetical protein
VLKEQLTPAMIDAGADLTAKLDEMGLPLSAAFWMFDVEISEWRLVFASPEMNTLGPHEVYAKIGQAIDQLGAKAEALPFTFISLLSPDADLVRRLTTAIPTGPGVSRIRFRKNVANGRFIEDALIYRAA